VFCIYLRTNSDLRHLHHKLIYIYNRNENCLQRGTNWCVKYSSVRIVFKGLIRISGVLVHLHLLVNVVGRKNNAGNELHQTVAEVFRYYYGLAFRLIISVYCQIIHFRCSVTELKLCPSSGKIKFLCTVHVTFRTVLSARLIRTFYS
jgi:hypothetical protein